jgi:glycosyltransferase involved in cell wall biosynthesis
MAEPSVPDEASRAPLRVAVDTAILRRPRTGIARFLEGLIDALAHDPGLDLVQLTGPRRVGNGVAFRPINVARQRWWYERGMRRQASKLGAGVLLMPSGYACRKGSIPQLVVIYDVNFLTKPGTYERLFSRYAAWAVRRAARDADAIVTISEFSRDEISLHLGVPKERINVVYPGLTPPSSGAASQPARPYALYVGSTERHKNVGLLLDVWEQHRPDLTLAIVGNPGRDHDYVLERARAIGDRVVVTGRVSGLDLEAWYGRAAVFLFPSLTEGFGYPPLEAMQRGVPVIAARAGSLPEVLGDAARYHSPQDSGELARLLDALVADPSMRRDMSAAGLVQAGRFTWTRAAGQISSILQEIATHA